MCVCVAGGRTQVLLKSASATLTKDGSKGKAAAGAEGVRALAETHDGDATQRAVYTLAVVSHSRFHPFEHVSHSNVE